ncbi:hypothetical protein EYF80_018710 [Liparis tanakae]|uniref:Uncharacterized protein n=1 Tax=Liparis tanakae TaxID=230148 RepID=A0A4Z2HYW0_9TELE|nr:hypothetical protein EYF80_018710 [Liparis tanakae]
MKTKGQEFPGRRRYNTALENSWRALDSELEISHGAEREVLNFVLRLAAEGTDPVGSPPSKKRRPLPKRISISNSAKGSKTLGRM